MLLKILFFLVVTTNLTFAIPPNDKALFDEDPESRISHKRRPCRGRSLPEGRTFFDWSFQYVDVNYNYNYNINCGGGGGGGHGGGGGGGPQKPILSGVLQSIGNRPTGGGHPPTGGLLGGNGISFIQSQFQGIFADGQGLGSLIPQNIFNGEGLGSLLPQGGLFNGQGISSLFENGLFSNIFSSSQSNAQAGVPSRPMITTPKPGGQDPDDTIYNDEKPVHEDHDPVVPDHYNRPGQYLVANNPIFGNFVYDVSDFNPNRIYRQFNKELNRLVRPWAHLLGR
ncbi:formin-like protein 7 isoform X1 [Tribolium madens]|uniref:formin-like protein 7 isoform X1 n=1 Tax=Tribolium madens TaxID=41895 RepID=UPI001CF754C6|nr:formin-like protein 7 isoform X1 [Tribolium madens]XP_044253567.1 formin-like protein 7 isoform X1 [Tribolium madens]